MLILDSELLQNPLFSEYMYSTLVCILSGLTLQFHFLRKQPPFTAVFAQLGGIETWGPQDHRQLSGKSPVPAELL